MKSNAKPRGPWFTRRELIGICNEKLVCAARDLAEFTKNGINASYIVALAHKCEDLEEAIDQPQSSQSNHVEDEITLAIHQICEMGRKI
ncbi:MAG: hypothetical protein AAF804_22340, partial [Bacteroidota bacterium]